MKPPFSAGEYLADLLQYEKYYFTDLVYCMKTVQQRQMKTASTKGSIPITNDDQKMTILIQVKAIEDISLEHLLKIPSR